MEILLATLALLLTNSKGKIASPLHSLLGAEQGAIFLPLTPCPVASGDGVPTALPRGDGGTDWMLIFIPAPGKQAVFLFSNQGMVGTGSSSKLSLCPSPGILKTHKAV